MVESRARPDQVEPTVTDDRNRTLTPMAAASASAILKISDAMRAYEAEMSILLNSRNAHICIFIDEKDPMKTAESFDIDEVGARMNVFSSKAERLLDGLTAQVADAFIDLHAAIARGIVEYKQDNDIPVSSAEVAVAKMMAGKADVEGLRKAFRQVIHALRNS
jgi:hypothetical protein